MSKLLSVALLVVTLSGLAVGQKPVVQLPKTYINTTWSQPTGGTTWAVHNSAQFTSTLNSSQPGDVIVLDAGVTYSGNFTLPLKSNPNHKWIYVISSAMAALPEGKRVSPADAVNMPRVLSPNSTQPVTIASGANYWRVAGVEITATSNYPTGCGTSGLHCMTYFAVNSKYNNGLARAHHIYFDRVYVHGAPTQDFQGGLELNWDWAAVVDSRISEIHIKGFDTNAIGANSTTGPIKIVNNHVEASTENIIFGGGGGNANPGVPSDIEIRNNYLYKPLAWAVPGVGVPPNQTMVVKNAFELKSAQRVLFDGNLIENVWVGGQLGFAIVLTPRSGQSGDFTVVNDITITNNILKNVVSGVNTLASDDNCGPGGGYPNCLVPGTQDRWNISNNLITFFDPTLPGGSRNTMIALNPGLNRFTGKPGVLRNVVFQHNTAVPRSTACFASAWFSTASQKPPLVHLTDNTWILDNVLCRQPTGDGGQQGTAGLTQYMGDPAPLDARYKGNVMYVPVGDKVQAFPVHNYASTLPLAYAAPGGMNYQLLTPYWTDTSDGRLAGVNYLALRNALANAGIRIPSSVVPNASLAPR